MVSSSLSVRGKVGFFFFFVELNLFFFCCLENNRYDFAVYGLLAPEIGQCFFPKSSRELQLINSFGIYLAAFLMRCVMSNTVPNGSLSVILTFPLKHALLGPFRCSII
jgi:hypothetical protein